MTHWRVWYDDGSMHEGASDDAWQTLPRHGVQIVRELGRAGNDLVHMGLDYYWLEDGAVRSCSRADLDRYLERPRGLAQVKFGRWASDHIWQQVHDEAL
jgi:hypothetical protein